MEIIKMLKCCLNPKVLIGLAGVAIGIAIFAPHALAAALPLLFVAVCPLSMVLMMVAMSKMANNPKPASSDRLKPQKLRYAKGEINDEQYEIIKQKLAKDRGIS